MRLQGTCGGDRVIVGDLLVVVLGNLRDGDTEAEETGIDGIEGFGDGRVIEEVAVKEGA